MSVNVLYKTSAKATGGRDGSAATLDGSLNVKLTTPKEHRAKYLVPQPSWPSRNFVSAMVALLIAFGVLAGVFGAGTVAPADAAVVTADTPVVAVPVAWARCRP